jgi:F-type H+-transporting ATPase subunit a
MFASILFSFAMLFAPIQEVHTAAPGQVAQVAAAQETPAEQEAAAADPTLVESAHALAEGDHSEEFDILHHVLDERQIQVPFLGYVQLPPAHSWQVGPIDLTPTKYVVFVWLIGILMLLVFIPAGAAARRSHRDGSPARGGHNAVEAIVLFFRDKVIMPNVGHGGEKYVPFIVALFAFILIGNLLGLLPYGGAATANISVTAGLALMAFVVIEAAGMRALGPVGYIRTMVYWNNDLPFLMRLPMALIMTPVEILGKLTKPFALAIRLMANMTAGKIVIYAILGLIFVFGSFAIAIAPVMMVVALTFLKIVVAFLQAYVFALLTSVFIGLIMHAH